MLDFRKTRKVDVTVTLNGRSVPVSKLILSHELGMLPTAIVSTAIDNQNTGLKRTVKLDLKRVGQLNQLLQDKFCNHFTTKPDLLIEADDGDGNQIKFPCYAGRPATQLMFGNLQVGMTGVHQQAVLNLFNPIIYQLTSYYLKHAQNLNPELKKTNSIAQRLHLLLQGAMADYKGSAALPWKFRSAPVDAMNQIALPKIDHRPAPGSEHLGIDAFLKASYDSTRIHGLEHRFFDDRPVTDTLSSLLASTPNFMGVAGAVKSSFCLEFNADWSGRAWLETLRPLEDPGSAYTTNVDSPNYDLAKVGRSRIIRAPVAEFSFNMAPQFEPPLLQVLVTGQGGRYYLGAGDNASAGAAATGSADGDTLKRMLNAENFASGLTPKQVPNDFNAMSSLTSVARYPSDVPKNAAGRYQTVAAPPWLYGMQGSPFGQNSQLFAVQTAAEKNFRDADTRLIGAVRRETQMGVAMATQQRVTESILEWFARQTFESLYLGSTTARVVIPLNLKIQVGRTYAVEADDGTPLFVGFLTSAVHDISVGERGDDGTAVTTLGFSHVKAPGFEINPRTTSAATTISQGPDQQCRFTPAGRDVLENLADESA